MEEYHIYYSVLPPFFVFYLVSAYTELSLFYGYIVFHIKMYLYVFNQFLIGRYLLLHVFCF